MQSKAIKLTLLYRKMSDDVWEAWNSVTQKTKIELYRCLIEPPNNCTCFRSISCVLGKQTCVYLLHIMNEKYTLHVIKSKHAHAMKKIHIT